MPVEVIGHVLVGICEGLGHVIGTCIGGLIVAACSCFPGDATVRMKDGTTKRMRDVRIGDTIWDGQQFTDVFMLSRADEAQSADYVTIITDSGNSMRCTTGHLIAVRDKCSENMEGEELKASELVQPGDYVQVTTPPRIAQPGPQWLKLQQLLRGLNSIDDSNDLIDEDDFHMALEVCDVEEVASLTQICTTEGRVNVRDFVQLARGGTTWRRVEKVSAPTRALDGTYNPLTLSGRLAVDDVVCSAYTVSNPPERFIPATAPVRQMYRSKGARTVQSWSDRFWDLETSRPKGWKEKSIPTCDVNSLPPSERNLSSTPAAFTTLQTQKINGAMHYVLDCQLQNGKKWTVAKRYSRCRALRDALTEAYPGVATIPFPSKSTSTMARRTQLSDWLNCLLATEPAVTDSTAMRSFLLEDRVKRVCMV